jgi:long-chain fatty acid transport protein
MKGIKFAFCLFTVCAVISHQAFANGYRILGLKGSKATAMGEAFIAQADDASAVAFNPAGLAQLKTTEADLEGTLINSYTERESPTGEKTDNKDQWQIVPAFYTASNLGTDKLGLGFGISFPNGLSSEWGEDSFARYVATYSRLTVVDFSPAIGLKVVDGLMIGGGLDFYYSDARLERMVDMGATMGAPGAMDVKSVLKGTGTAWGYNLGTLYQINPKHSLALTFHAPYTIEYDGDVDMLGMKNDMSTSIDYPAYVVAGYAFRPVPKLKLEFNLDWTRWNTVNDITVHFDNPAIPDSVIEEGLMNTMAYKFGVEYLLNAQWALRCGYIYNENATPEETWSPSLPDTDTHFALAGFSYKYKNFTVNTTGQLVFYETRTIDNNLAMNETLTGSSIDGTYRTFAPCLSVGAAYAF